LRSVRLRNPRSNRTCYDKRLIFKYAIALLISSVCFAQTALTYAERFGWNKGDRVPILHMDDAGMSYDSDIGIEQVLEKGAARSLSVMMPTPWVPHIVR
jgi:chitin disaccharide deacetylase